MTDLRRMSIGPLTDFVIVDLDAEPPVFIEGANDGDLLVSNASGHLDLTTTGDAGIPTGPAVSTDEAIVRFDGITGKILQNSAITITDGGDLIVVDTIGIATDTNLLSLSADLLTVNGAASLTGNLLVGSTIGVAGQTNLLALGVGQFIVNGDETLNGDLDMTGDLQVNGGDIGITADQDLLQLAIANLTVNGNETITGQLLVASTIGVPADTNLLTLTSNLLTVAGALTATGALTVDSASVGGGYGSTGVTISSAGVIQANGAITTDGVATMDSAVIGGGYGSAGITMSNAGVFQANGAATIDGTITTSGSLIADVSGNDLVLQANSVANQLVLDSGGNVGLGTATPIASLDVQGDVRIKTANNTITINGSVRTPAVIIEADDDTSSGMLGVIDTSTAGRPFNYDMAKQDSGAVADGDVLGVLRSLAHDGTDYNTSAAIKFGIDGAVAANTVPGYIALETATGNSLVEHMRVTPAGNVGIGTTGPGSLLTTLGGDVHISGDDEKLLFGVGTDAEVYSDGAGLVIRTLTEDEDLFFYVNTVGVDTNVLTLNAGNERVEMPRGRLHLGADDSIQGLFRLFGAATNDGGVFRVYTAANQDTNTDYYILGIAPASEDFTIRAVGGAVANSQILLVDGTTRRATFNPEGNDQDFRIEGGTDAALFTVDASADGVGISTATPNATFDVDGTTRLGDSTTNYSGYAADGFYTGVGDARVYSEARFSAGVGFKGVGLREPDVKIDSNGLALVAAFASNQEEELFYVWEIDHAYEAGSDMLWHIHWNPSTAAAGNVEWKLEYLVLRNDNGETTGGASTTVTIVDSTNSAADESLKTSNVTLDGTGWAGEDLMFMRVYRDGTGADTYGADAHLTSHDIEFIANTRGEHL